MLFPTGGDNVILFPELEAGVVRTTLFPLGVVIESEFPAAGGVRTMLFPLEGGLITELTAR
jgi:hypothetical protein